MEVFFILLATLTLSAKAEIPVVNAVAGYRLVFNESGRQTKFPITNWGPANPWSAHTPYGGDYELGWFGLATDFPGNQPNICSTGNGYILMAEYDQAKKHHYHPIELENSSCALGLEQICGRLLAVSV